MGPKLRNERQKKFTFVEMLIEANQEIFHPTNFFLGLFLLCFLVQLFYYFYYFLPLSFRVEKKSTSSNHNGVSVIIAFRNEEENLKRNLPSLLEQNYPKYEILFVNDHSEDDGPDYLSSVDDARLQILNLVEANGKKAAIQLGIQKAKFDILLFTDADCSPISEEWISEMTNSLNADKSIAIGYGSFRKEFSFLNWIQRYENFMNMLQNHAFSKRSKAVMGVGRNLAYRKEVFEKSTAFEKYEHIRSGDDDLIVNEMSNASNTAFIENIKSHTISSAANSWKDYFFQKRRHLEAGKYYLFSDRLKLGIFGLSQLIFNLLFITLLIGGDYLPIILSIFVGKIFLQLMNYAAPMRRLGEFDLFWLMAILEIIYLPFITLVGISQYLWKVERWK